MDKIDMSLDDIIKQNRKETRKLAKQKKPATKLKTRPSGPTGQKQGKKPGLVKGGLQVKGRVGQFRARIGGKKTLSKGVARLQQQGATRLNKGPARKIGKQRVPIKKAAGKQVIRRQQQQQQRVQTTKAARQQQFNQTRGIQTIAQTPQTPRKKAKGKQQNVVNVQTYAPQTNQQMSRRQQQKIKRLQQNQPAPKTTFINTQRQNNQKAPQQKANQRGANKKGANQKAANQKAANQRVAIQGGANQRGANQRGTNQGGANQRVNNQQRNTPKINPKLLTVSISNPRAMQNFKPVKINRNKPAMQVGGTLNDRFGQIQQQPRNIPNKQRRKQQQGNAGNAGRTVVLV